MTQFVTLRLYTHYPDNDHKIGSTLHTLHEVPREAVVQILTCFYKGDGYTSVHESSLKLLTAAERAELEGV